MGEQEEGHQRMGEQKEGHQGLSCSASGAQRERQTDQVHITAFPHGILGVGPTLPRLESQLDVAFPAA